MLDCVVASSSSRSRMGSGGGGACGRGSGSRSRSRSGSSAAAAAAAAGGGGGGGEGEGVLAVGVVVVVVVVVAVVAAVAAAALVHHMYDFGFSCLRIVRNKSIIFPRGMRCAAHESNRFCRGDQNMGGSLPTHEAIPRHLPTSERLLLFRHAHGPAGGMCVCTMLF